ncbi:nitrogenase component I subunit alpha [Halorhabdus sp. BNX81]|uniref:nitrogenase component I subunit alpha n=1 Tax=Halorhabdus sp. BNX81 TaxID=2980181 RepID=UPI0023DD6286|nr:nitrogenase component I subunit alpha [Halorhabdus sp. BNX81]WEL20650.1 Nitrogenase molybdenum-iron protein alpha chain [Halorhabdus sp. BNX81]
MRLNCNDSIPDRDDHVVEKGSEEYDPENPGECIDSNEPTTPGDMTERGCTYAGCRGVVGGPVKDVLHVTHGPTGCAYYSWGYRPHLASDTSQHMDNVFVSNLQENQIIMGGEDRLLETILEAHEEFPDAEGIFVYNTCSPALIGDDGFDVAKRAEEEIDDDVPVTFFPCAGFSGVSQSKGHHVGNNVIFDELIDPAETPEREEMTINIVGEYNIKGDLEVIRPPLEELGLDINVTFTGDGDLESIRQMPKASLNVVHCARSAGYITDMIEDAYGTPSIEVSFWGTRHMSKAIEKVADFFDIEERGQEVIESELDAIDDRLQYYRDRLEGNRVFIYQGGPRCWHWPPMLEEDLGMDVVAVGSTFGHADDHRKIFERVGEDTLVVDNPNGPELEEILADYDIDLFISGNKEKFLAYKRGISFVNGHSYDSGPYAGFRGLLGFAEDMDKAVNNPVWDLVGEEAEPFGGDGSPDVLDHVGDASGVAD